MTVETSRQIRRRINQIEAKMFRPKRRAVKRALIVPLESEVRELVDKHMRLAMEAIERNEHWMAYYHTKDAVGTWRSFRALEIARDYNRAMWKACEMARRELYDSRY